MVRKRSSDPPVPGPSKKVLTQSVAANRVLQSNQYAVLIDDNGDGDAVAVAKKERIPPLFTPEKDVGQLKNELAKHKLHPRFKLCSVGTKIMCSSLEEYKTVGSFLKDNKVDFFTHDLASLKPLKVVLRGLPSFEAATVKAELERLGLKPEAVFPMNRRQNTTFRDQLFLVHFSKGTTSLAVLKANIRDLFQVIISWEPYRPQHRDVTQCMNCLNYGHGTKNCHMKPCCNKCAGAHSTASCEQAEGIVPTCANCGGNHSASTRDCPKRAEFIAIRQKASTGNQPGRHRNNRPPPTNTVEQFPALQPRRLVPNLPPLPLNNQRASREQASSSTRSAQHRLVAAAAQPDQGPSVAPGLSYASIVAGESADESVFTPDELLMLVAEVITIMRTCKTRSAQLQAALSLVMKYGP